MSSPHVMPAVGRFRRFVPWFALFLGAGCESMAPSGHPFEPLEVEPTAAAAVPAAEVDFTPVEPLKLTSEQMAAGTVAIGTAAGVDVDSLPVPSGTEAPPAGGGPSAAPVAPPAAPTAPPMALASPWPVRLLSTLPQAQPPRAILGLPDGSERVVSPGSMVAEAGVVVMMIGPDHVQLAKIEPAGDHAAIQTVELNAQYTAPPR